MKHSRQRSAFSMLELIFVIAILGIVASLGAEMIAKVYDSYILQRAQHRATIKTGLAATQIANRLVSAIPGTVVRRLTKTGTTEDITDDMLLDPSGDTYTVLQWVGSDTDGFNYYNTATDNLGWSGFCDIDNSTKSSINTPGSELSAVNTIADNLDLNSSDFAIYFPYDPTATAYFGSGTTNTITLNNTASKHIVEHYKLASTSYALVAEINTEGRKDLYLYYGFSPVRGVDVSGNKSLLMKNISTFKFKGSGRTIRFKICKEENIGEDYNVTACKEKAVY